MSYSNKISNLIPSQLPEFIRDDPDYQNFVLFLQAYYEWMEQEGGSLYGSANLKNYSDIDNTLDEFLQYYKNQFLPFFPEGSLVDQRKLTKIAHELYKTKGTPASYKFLFRVLYNTDVQLYNARDFILRASDGKWVITRILNLYTEDPRWLSAINYRLFGETSKGYATIENVIVGNNITQVVLSNIDRNFTTGEYVRAIDNNGYDIIVDSLNVRSQILGVISSVIPDPNNQGSGYNVGDPVVFYGGLNPSVENPSSASGYVSSVTSASIVGATPVYKGQGYRSGSYTQVNIVSGSGLGSNAHALATSFDTANPYYVYLVPNDTIESKSSIQLNSGSYNFSNLTNANINTKLINALSFPILNTFGISAVSVTSGGTGYDSTTTANAVGYYSTDTSSLEDLPSLGILAPIEIIDGGLNYRINDTIVFSGGSGYGAYANVTAIGGSGEIQEISYIFDPSNNNRYPLGGMGYQYGLPDISINTSTGSGASVYLHGLVGGDATFSLNSTTYGQVLEIALTNEGKDYTSTPNVSLRVKDMLVTNVSTANQPKTGDKIYQGTLTNQTFIANVDSILTYSSNSANTLSSTYNLRVYDYNGLFDLDGSIYVSRSGVDIGANIFLSQQTTGIYTLGRKIYGNGSAKATVAFTNGVQYGSGFYENADGQPSAYSILEDQNYNNYAYILQLEAALSKYKDSALSFLHPSGMKYNTFNLLKNNVNFTNSMTSEQWDVQKLGYLLNNYNYVANVASGSSNTITFSNLSGSNLANVVFANSFVTIQPTRGASFYSNVESVTANTIKLKEHWITSVGNVALATASANSTTINIINITNAWNIATGNIVSYFSDFMSIYDKVSFDGITYKEIVHVDQPGTGTSITINSPYTTAQSGYLSFTQNVLSSNVLVSGRFEDIELVNLLTEDGQILIAEDGKIIILG